LPDAHEGSIGSVSARAIARAFLVTPSLVPEVIVTDALWDVVAAIVVSTNSHVLQAIATRTLAGAPGATGVSKSFSFTG
jgi:hypothetical protein